jgi:hypothetical protein
MQKAWDRYCQLSRQVSELLKNFGETAREMGADYVEGKVVKKEANNQVT